MTDLQINGKNFRDNMAKEQITKAVFETVRSEWTELRDVQQILISITGQLAIAETHLAQRTPDDLYACACGVDHYMNIRVSDQCKVHAKVKPIVDSGWDWLHEQKCDHCDAKATSMAQDIQLINMNGFSMEPMTYGEPRFGCEGHPVFSRTYDSNGCRI